MFREGQTERPNYGLYALGDLELLNTGKEELQYTDPSLTLRSSAALVHGTLYQTREAVCLPKLTGRY